MILLSNCLTDVTDEGCLKVANSLAKRIKQMDENVTVVSFRRQSQLTDIYLEVNKLLLSMDLIRLIRERREPILFFPFQTRPLADALRIFILSLISPEKVKVVLTMTRPYGVIGRLLLRISNVHLVALSGQSARFYAELVGRDRVTYLKSGVDTKRFAPVSPRQMAELKKKYGLDPNRKVVLHVGHMKAGRNVAELMKLDTRYQILLVVSTFTSLEQDKELRKKLESCENIKIIDNYISNIEELYQLSDVYFFPVVESGNCIDVPLSCLEAASCGKPVVTTSYGEMCELEKKSGFYFIDTMEKTDINRLMNQAVSETGCNSRAAVLEYDWDCAARAILEQ